MLYTSMALSKAIELRHLRAFLAVAEELNFRAAAERLNLSQPPVSRMIAQMEELMGRTLFVRSRHRVDLTRAGAALLPRARDLLASFERLDTGLPPADTVQDRQARVGVFFAVHPSAQSALQGLLGAADVEVARSHELTRSVRNGRIDGALVMLPAPTAGLFVHVVGRAHMHAALPAAHSLARKRSVAVSDLGLFPRLLFLGRRQNPPLYSYLNQALRSRGLAEPRYSVPSDPYAGLAQIASGQACTLLCSWVGDFVQTGVALRPLRKSDSIQVEIGWVTRTAQASTGRAVGESMQSLFAGWR